MEDKIKDLLNLSIEIEGLIRVIQSNYSDEAYNLLIDKNNKFNDLVVTLVPDEVVISNEVIADDPQTDDEQHDMPEIKSVEDTNDTEDKLVIVDDEEIETINDLNSYVPRLEDVLAKKSYQSISKAFTLNDKYRFIRGLFCDDKNDFDFTVAKISEFKSLDEAYDYLLNELEWDIDNDEVKAFISIISNYFNAH